MPVNVQQCEGGRLLCRPRLNEERKFWTLGCSSTDTSGYGPPTSAVQRDKSARNSQPAEADLNGL